MEKGIIITGNDEMHKKFLANELLANYTKDEWTWLPKPPKDHAFGFSVCTKETKILIIEEVEAEDFESFFAYVPGKIPVHQQLKEPFYITAKIVLICKASVKLDEIAMTASLSRRFDFIHCDHK